MQLPFSLNCIMFWQFESVLILALSHDSIYKKTMILMQVSNSLEAQRMMPASLISWLVLKDTT